MTPYIRRLPARPASKNIVSAQGTLDLRIDRERDVDGIGMGILTDGTPFLNQRGLARMCGVQNAHIGFLGGEWNEPKPRTLAVKKILASRGYDDVESPFIKVRHGSTVMYAYPDYVCLAVLEYYAFEAGPNIQEEAKQKYRWLAGRSLRDVIYDQLGYQPASAFAKVWQQFQDRVSLVYDNVPPGFFCVFKEIADLMVTLINAGADVGDRFVPDISVGRAWSDHWVAGSIDQLYGERRSYEHHYPNYFPQARSNPQFPFCYPDAALGEFRRFMREDYLPTRLPTYLAGQAKKGLLSETATDLAVKALVNRAQSARPLPPPKKVA
jgi:hypothetical protein